MKAEIIAIGSELTCGARLDTNSQWLSRELEALGWSVHRHTTVADDIDSMVRIFREAAERSRVVLITGGLGPTLDDITRETLAQAFDQPLIEDLAALQHIESLFRSRGREMPERNRVQALRPRDAETLHNAHGTAPGVLLEVKDPECTIGVMPGVPTEMKRMFFEQLVSRLPQSRVVVTRHLIRTFGYGESDAERLLGELTARGRNPEVGITASNAVISLSVTARAGSRQECELLTDPVRQTIRERLGTAVFAEEDIDLHDVVSQLLNELGMTVGLLEGTSTGGLLAHWLTEHEERAHIVAWAEVAARDPGTTDSSVSAINSDTVRGFADRSPGVCEVVTNRARRLIAGGAADFVMASTAGRHRTDDNGIRRLSGEVSLIGPDFCRTLDVSMTGNLAIFRERAARTALNLLRLHLIRGVEGK